MNEDWRKLALVILTLDGDSDDFSTAVDGDSGDFPGREKFDKRSNRTSVRKGSGRKWRERDSNRESCLPMRVLIH